MPINSERSTRRTISLRRAWLGARRSGRRAALGKRVDHFVEIRCYHDGVIREIFQPKIIAAIGFRK